MRLLVTGSAGLVGSEVVSFFGGRDFDIWGIDNNFRQDLFGPEGDTRWNVDRLKGEVPTYRHCDLDIRNQRQILDLFRESGPFDLIVHCAAQPSHDLARIRPRDDFEVNAVGTFNLLEATRTCSPNAVFVLMSTNKVYGDAPNELPLVRLPTRWDYARPENQAGISEEMRIDQSQHSLFGASKVAADVLTQEYGKSYGLRTTCLRAGCITGPQHAGVELHGFLSYLIKANLTRQTYRIIGYEGRQVRDNIHSLDVARAIEAVYKVPRCGEVYNLGGGRQNSCSIIEAIAMIEEVSGIKMIQEYDPSPRPGDHICYISDLTRFRDHYPQWNLAKSLADIVREIHDAWIDRLGLGRKCIVAGLQLPVAHSSDQPLFSSAQYTP